MSPEVEKRIRELMELHGEGLATEAVIEDARSEDSPLHAEFEWDPVKAHPFYLRDRARQIVRSWYVQQSLSEGRDVRMRGAISLPTGRSASGRTQRAYFPLESVFTNSERRRLALDGAARDARAFQSKYRALSEVANVIKAMDEFIAQIEPGEPDEGTQAVAAK